MRRVGFFLFFPLYFLLSMPYLAYGRLLGWKDRQARIRLAYGFTRLTSRLLLGMAGAKLHFQGVENIPRDRAVLFVGNHRSMLDIPLLMMAVDFPIAFIAKQEMDKVLLMRGWVHLLDCVLLDRKDPRKALKSILYGIDKLKAGESLVVFPEGTRTPGDRMLPFKQGSLQLAEKSGVPVVPFGIQGTEAVLEQNGWNLKPGDVSIRFGTPLDLSNLGPEEQKRSAAYVQNLVEALIPPPA
ncbi:lysophospholipid acyltransferase family protein [Anaerotalea alkaliphila]|uniref:1-acyl-sn-glycerol-3-phosphate acyltransferase n=1 Tax=Anaerotalea alkaliphila TaxID=2662126 RepID=A0A7X5HX44_9FIRM|nr:lysophospholipid acyltransferase family protein [Anaerotalea alkaliphila]NDL68278.1 1-acyl-sn-glycerol-3-phosphate acyltransferase [Anaerotalea alkaliphila]